MKFPGTAPLLTQSSRILAITNLDGSISVLRDRCVTEGACETRGEIAEERIDLPPGVGLPDQVLLGSTGRWMLVRTGRQLYALELGSSAAATRLGESDFLVGTLRSGDVFIVRDGPQLRAWDMDTLDSTELGGSGLFALAMGERSVIARRRLDSGDDQVVLVAVTPSKRNDVVEPGEELPLLRGPSPSRVVLTRGPSPDVLGRPDDLHTERPTDSHVAITVGTADENDSKTYLFDAGTGELVDQIAGGVQHGREVLGAVPGLSPVSPDGRQLAFITPRGSLALHDLHTGAQCLVRSSTAGVHVVAGFSGAGTIVTERKDEHGRQVLAYDMERHVSHTLSPPGLGITLRAVPAGGAEGIPTWALGNVDGRTFGLAPDAEPQALGLKETAYLPRNRPALERPDTLWLVEADDDRDEPDTTEIRLQRVRPVLRGDGTLRFPLAEEPQTCPGGDCDSPDADVRPFTRAYNDSAPVCFAASRVNTWSTECTVAADRREFLRAHLPASELPN
jgi:hypothetical protein